MQERLTKSAASFFLYPYTYSYKNLYNYACWYRFHHKRRPYF